MASAILLRVSGFHVIRHLALVVLMIQFFQRTTRFAVGLIGLVGMVFSGYAVQQIWITANQLTREVPQAIGQLEVVGQSVLQQGESAVDVLLTSRNQLASIRDMVEALSADSPDRRIANVFTRLDTEVVARLERAEEFVQTMQQSLENASRAVLLLESIPFIGRPVASEGDNLSGLAASLAEISTAFGRITQILAEIRTTRTVDPASVSQLNTALELVDGQLHRLQSGVESFSVDTSALVERLVLARKQSRHWVRRTAMWCTVFFICFGFSQFHLLVDSWAAMRTSPVGDGGADLSPRPESSTGHHS